MRELPTERILMRYRANQTGLRAIPDSTTGDETTEFEITIHRTTPIPGTDALIGYSDDHPDKQFLITPKEQP